MGRASVAPDLRFERDTAMRQRLLPHGSLLPPIFPAKMGCGLIGYLVRTYTQPGDTILDCFLGCGTTLLATLQGRHVIGVELESHWREVAERNAAHLHHSLTPPTGRITILQGDSRTDLPRLLLGEAPAAIVTSPPYCDEINQPNNQDTEGYWHKFHGGRHDKQPRRGGSAAPDAVITSPPFMDDLGRPGRTHEADKYLDRMGVNGIIRAQSTGYVEAVVTSPPYDQSLGSNRAQDGGTFVQRLAADGSEGAAAMSLGYVDACVTSPPFEACPTGGSAIVEYEAERNPAARPLWESFQAGFGKTAGNIGEEAGQRYLDSMRQVYAGCYAVLRPGGVACVVIGNVVREGREVMLNEQTAALLTEVGFTLRETLVVRKPALSFWRRLHKKRFPDAPVIDAEHVIVADKLGG